MKIDDFLSRLKKVKPQGNGHIACCPAHQDTNPSLSITKNNKGDILLHCHAGCSTDDIVAALGLTMADLFDKPASPQQGKPKYKQRCVYDYHDESGARLFQVVRRELTNSHQYPNADRKKFLQRRPDGNGGWIYNIQGVRRVLYRLPGVIKADPKATVFIAAGEKDADRLQAASLVATTNPGGEGKGKWLDDYNQFLKDRDVVILPDNDDTGRAHAEAVACSLHGVARSIKVLALPNLPEGGDVSDWLNAGGDAEHLCVMAEEAPEWTPQTTGAADPNAPASKESITQQLIKLALAHTELFHDAGGDGYATITIGKHRETHKLGARNFKDWLAGLFYRETKRAAGGDSVGEAITVLRAQARYEAPLGEAHLRVAEHAGAIYLDLCDEEWQQIKITEDGWQIIAGKDSPVRFRRAGGMLALPGPVRGGELRELRELLNLPPDDPDNDDQNKDGQDIWALLLAWLVATFKPCNVTPIAYPILAVHGEQGSAKSTTCRLLRRLIDPNKADLRAAPRDERDLAITAEHARVLGFDNLTELTKALSNALCRIATGGGFATRELFSDEGEVIFDSRRPVMLNGIAEVAAQSDLLDRAILIYLPQISKQKRRLERVIDSAFAAARPRILACLLDAVSAGLKRLRAGVELKDPPRMADFAEWAVACEEGLGLKPGQFLRAYERNCAQANGLALEASPVAEVIIKWIKDGDWIKDGGDQEMTTGALLKKLNRRLEAAGELPKKKPNWPQNARALGARLKELAPNLRRSGIDVIFGKRGSSGYKITLKVRNDVHDVHDVQEPNEDNGLSGEHREHRCEP